MKLNHKALFILASLAFATSNHPPTGPPSSASSPNCPILNHRVANSTVTNTITSFATSVQTRFVISITTTTTNNTVFSTVFRTVTQPPCEPAFNSNPPFVNPHWIWLKYCNGPAAPNNGGCTGDCKIYAQNCTSDDESWQPRQKLHGCQFKAHDTQCIETNGKVVFRTCSLDIAGKRADPWVTCTTVCDFNPGVTVDGTWIYNTRWTQHVDVYPNPDGVWAKDFNNGLC